MEVNRKRNDGGSENCLGEDLMHKLLAIARNLLNRPGKDKEEAAEIRAYVALLADEFQASGMSQSEAERAAKVHCGGVLHLEQTVRDRRTGIKVELHWQDIRFAFRQFRRHLLFTTVALVSLVVGTSSYTCRSLCSFIADFTFAAISRCEATGYPVTPLPEQ